MESKEKAKKMMKLKFQPSENKVVMRTVALNKDSKIIGAENADVEDPTQRGIIYASGSDLYEVGDVIVYNKCAAVPLKLDQGLFLISGTEAILGKVTD